MDGTELSELRPALMVARVIARVLDLVHAGVLLVALSFAVIVFVAVANAAVGLGTSSASLNDYEEAAHLFVVGAVVALGREPWSLMRKGTTRGKAHRGIELRLLDHPNEPASSKRLVGRYLVSVGACAAVTGLSLVAVSVLGASLSAWGVVGVAAASSGLVWLSALLSVLFRADRRGWHDVAAGTVLVTALPMRKKMPRRGSPR